MKNISTHFFVCIYLDKHNLIYALIDHLDVGQKVANNHFSIFDLKGGGDIHKTSSDNFTTNLMVGRP